MSCIIVRERPDSAEPSKNKTMANTKTRLRPNRSESLPYSGTVIVEARRYAVTTHDRCSKPWRSATIAGSAVATIV